MKPLCIACVVAQFNSQITSELLKNTVYHLKAEGVEENNIHPIYVPGAIEIPLIAAQCAKQQIYHAIIAIGCVIQGETKHFDYVCNQVSYGTQKVALQYHIPVIFGILTTENYEQAWARADVNGKNKGKDFALSALQMITTMSSLRN